MFGRPAHTLAARRDVGLAEQDINLDRFLTVRETLVYHGGYFGMPGAEADGARRRDDRRVRPARQGEHAHAEALGRHAPARCCSPAR